MCKIPVIGMVTKEEAIKIVRDALPEDCDVMLDSVIEKGYGWVIFAQSKEYIQTKDPLTMLYGSGGILVEKATGNMYRFGSVPSLDDWLRDYELGYLEYVNRSIEVVKVINKRKTIKHLSKLRMDYVVYEKAHGKQWEITKKLTRKQIKLKLNSLPAKFNLDSARVDRRLRWQILESFKKQSDFEYQLIKNFVNGLGRV